MPKARRRIIAGQSATEFEDGRGGTVSISGAKRRLPLRVDGYFHARTNVPFDHLHRPPTAHPRQL